MASVSAVGSESLGLPEQCLVAWRASLQADHGGQAATGSLHSTSLDKALLRKAAVISAPQVFNLRLSREVTPIVDQKESGRCWLYAVLNCARHAFAKKYNVADFQFSVPYLSFYDKLERANLYLESILNLPREANLDGRNVEHMNGSLLRTGGSWDMAAALISKYGLVPLGIYPATCHFEKDESLSSVLRSMLRQSALELITMRDSALQDKQPSQLELDIVSAEDRALEICRAYKDQQLQIIFNILAMTLGLPPQPDTKVMYEYYEVTGTAAKMILSPMEIYESLKEHFSVQNRFSVTNDPRHGYGKLMVVKSAGRMLGMGPVRHVNTTIEEMEELVLRMLRADQPIWLACDVRKDSNDELSTWSTKLYDHAGIFGMSLSLSKADRIRMQDTGATHAVVIVAAHVEDGKAVRYRIENSYSDSFGNKGYFVCTSEWFREHAFEIIVRKDMTSAELGAALEDPEPVELPPWNPLG